MIRIGFSKDVHPLVEGEKLLIGGIEIEHYKGSSGYSDGDCLLHAIAESILGALALGDLGKFFPDDNPKYKDYDSKLILKEVFDYVQGKGYEISNLDCMISLQKPKLRPYINGMREVIAGILKCDIKRVSIKATTHEGLGFVGEEKGILCEAIVLLERSDFIYD
ncbi:2-C-methyl-D-erythritol 2,4-cyclodiphosphate synthase [Hujiaoplasma nucleasis]|uniref:2-C-methyl-D-erythritol 2,4-cyclodiphosphate synthase n=1 Tax=Hujiaoplasma nucleasis TaxID=2725268 RepID=A0A7L6N7H3_9MOLU|nr:2-C-methyl-D-erythritol 2,4-cyclodiphosphate synthase [Hujiaoplasma nucleasis]QLY40489.1 2-C-methyl-D-erythritol 2,4-cyclodiphosphate synthase [Hujiaoplasma nucleasis]